MSGKARGVKAHLGFFLRKFIQIERFKSTFKTHLKKWKKCNHVTMDDLRKAISGDILKATVEKSQTNVASATMNHLRKAIWGDIWKRTLEKNETNATIVTMHHLRQAIWGLICRGKKQTNVTDATLHPFKQAFSHFTLCILSNKQFGDTFVNPQWRKIKQMQPK